jgi:hypothetical protein
VVVPAFTYTFISSRLALLEDLAVPLSVSILVRRSLLMIKTNNTRIDALAFYLTMELKSMTLPLKFAFVASIALECMRLRYILHRFSSACPGKRIPEQFSTFAMLLVSRGEG